MNHPIPSILEEIITQKQCEVAESIKTMPVEVIEHMIVENDLPVRSFYGSLKKNTDNNKNAVIAEIKKASPSKGIICEDFNSQRIAQSYEEHGACCLSVLTDEKFFQGSELYLDEARSATKLPVLRKDFIISEYQIFESRVMGADCILLIAACLSHQEMLQFTRLAYDLGMDVLVEIHNIEDLEKVVGLPIRMIGVNNRNLNTFEVDLSTTISLVEYLPPDIMVITESGITTRDDVELMNTIGVQTFLVGESLMKSDNPGHKLFELFN
ncbi:MAG: indole-3-glycerol phosphate synthase TrpC [Gammaproteobacteria bacterium]|nr:indole-3-glycerol phosphate synthase TrpC [Gammaproteobacteria bacterium]